jgi:hypothetical protein
MMEVLAHKAASGQYGLTLASHLSTQMHQEQSEPSFLVDGSSFLRYVSNRDRSIEWLNPYQVR